MLLIEVADSSLDYDLGEKSNLYAEAGILDYWVIDIPAQQVHVLRNPGLDGYQSHQTISGNERLVPLLVKNRFLDVANLFACLDDAAHS